MSKRTDNELKPWERQPGETEASYNYFKCFLQLGANRTHEMLAREINISTSQIRKISARWNWVERCSKHGDEMSRVWYEEQKKAIKDMAKRHVQQSMMYQRALTLPVEELMKREKNPSHEKFAKIDQDKLFRLVAAGADAFCKVVTVERISRGEPGEISNVNESQTIVVVPPEYTKSDA